MKPRSAAQPLETFRLPASQREHQADPAALLRAAPSHDARLQRRGRERRRQPLADAPQTVGHRDQDVGHAARPQIV